MSRLSLYQECHVIVEIAILVGSKMLRRHLAQIKSTY
jgi:hypothetical protein